MSAADELAAVQSALGAAQKRLARQQQRHWGLTPRMLRVALRVFLLTGLDNCCAQRFVNMVRRRRCWPDQSHDDDAVPMQELLAAWPANNVLRLLDPDAPEGLREFNEARTFVAKLRTCEWIRRQNFDHGVAPEVRSVLHQYNRYRCTYGLAANPALVHALTATEAGKPRLARYGRTWAQRFRKRFVARFFFHRCDWCEQQALANGTPPLWLNFDESSIQKGQGGASGAVVARPWWPVCQEPVDRFAGKFKKVCSSLLLTVSPEPEVQDSLPQIFLGNRATFPAGVTSLEEPGSSEFWRQSSAWNSGPTMIRYLDRLASALEGHQGRQVILVCDCASMHVTRAVLETAKFRRIWLLLIPPECTYVLQPADCSVFGQVKFHLRRQMEGLKQEKSHGAVSTLDWLEVLKAFPQFLRLRSWQRAFERCGITGDRSSLLPILHTLSGYHAANAAGFVEIPTPEAMAGIYPGPIADKHWLFMQPTVPELA
eukprot:s596_g10.t1